MWIEIGTTQYIYNYKQDVAPFAGVWIEINLTGNYYQVTPVAPFAGVWIEIGTAKCVQR